MCHFTPPNVSERCGVSIDIFPAGRRRHLVPHNANPVRTTDALPVFLAPVQNEVQRGAFGVEPLLDGMSHHPMVEAREKKAVIRVS